MRFQWPLEIKELQDIQKDGLEVKELTLQDILLEGLITLKKIEIHLQSLSGEEIDNDDITISSGG